MLECTRRGSHAHTHKQARVLLVDSISKTPWTDDERPGRKYAGLGMSGDSEALRFCIQPTPLQVSEF
jgi:hypothetical protein